LGGQSEKWNKLARIQDREREVACRAYLDLIAGRTTENVKQALRLSLGSPMLIEVPYILELIGDAHGKKVLDSGCGTGFYSLWLSEKGAKVLGVDSSQEMIKVAKEKASSKNLDVRFLIGDVTRLKMKDAAFDVVLSTLVLTEVKELGKAISEFVRVAKKGGDIIISIQHPLLTGGDWERESGQKLFRKIDNYFTERELEVIWESEKKERVPFKFYHRPLRAYIQPFLERGCILTNLVEPYPHESYAIFNPREYEDTKRIPHFAILKFRKHKG
jgi:ubiquinone/menaquinone biosynthesis C-methylase UbiE